MNTVAELIQQAEEAGYSVTPEQIKRWHVTGLLPAPKLKRLGKAKGTLTIYPEETASLLLAVCQEHLTEKRLLIIAWTLFWRGMPVPMKSVQAFLNGQKRRLQKNKKHLVKIAEEASDGTLEKRIRRFDALTREIYRRVGPEDFALLVQGAFVMTNGAFQEWVRDRPEFYSAMSQAFQPLKITPQQCVGLANFLKNFFASTKYKEVDIIAAREELQAFLNSLRPLAELLTLFSHDLGRLTKNLFTEDANIQSYALFGMLVLRQTTDVRGITREYEKTANADETQTALRWLPLLKQIQVLNGLFTADKMEALQGNPIAKMEFDRRIKQSSVKNDADIRRIAAQVDNDKPVK